MSHLRSLLVLLAFTATAIAQSSDTTSVAGIVKDITGAVVPGVEVTATNIESSAMRTTVTDSTGAYFFAQLKPGSYRIKATHTGFKTVTRDVQLLVASPGTVDFEMPVGATNEMVEVAASNVTVNTYDATVGNAIGENAVKTLPLLARNAASLLTLQPGVIQTGASDTDLLSMGSTRNLDERDGAVNGVRSNQTNVTVDGIDSNNWETQAAFSSALPVTLDSIQEFRVTTSNANPTEGVSGGAQVALVTKSGSNNWHGNLRWYHRNTATAANSYFNNLNDIEKPKLMRHIGGGSLGGPIKKNRAYFFVDYEFRRDRSEEGVRRYVPSDILKSGNLIYAVDSSVEGFNSSDPNLFPCPNGNGEFCRTLTGSDLAAIDPAGLGVNPAMLNYMAQYPTGNDPTQGLDAGLSFTGFRFNSPLNTDNHVWTSRLDFNLTQDGKHTLYWRGTLGNIRTALAPSQFPGQDTSSTLRNNTKGFAMGYTAQLSDTLINTVRYGLTRLGISESGSGGSAFSVRSFSDVRDFAYRPLARQIPIHDIKDDLTWMKGSHSFQLGGSMMFTRAHRSSYNLSYPAFSVNNGFCAAQCSEPLTALTEDADPSNDPLDANSFVRAFMMLTGPITQVNASYLVDAKSKEFLPSGSPLDRHYAANDFELYFQDTWRLKQNLTLTAGLRWSYFSPVWETNGNMVRPTVDVSDWWAQRVSDQLAGIPSDAMPLLQFDLAGKANGKSGWWNPDHNDFAPRVALAWSPPYDSGILKGLFGGPGKSSVRLGAGMFYNRFGGALAVTTDNAGSPGMSNALISSAGAFGLDTTPGGWAMAPRFSGTCDATGCTGLPDVSDFITPPTTASFPFTPDASTAWEGFMVDNNLRTPYSINLTFGIQRELPWKMVLDTSYVGTLGRKLMVKPDLGQFYGLFTDPASKQTFWGAYNQLVDYQGPDPYNPTVNPYSVAALSSIPNIAFFDNVMPNLPIYLANFLGEADIPYSTLTPTQAYYAMFTTNTYASYADPVGFIFDVPPAFGAGSPYSSTLDPQGNGLVLFHPQFQSIPTWMNWGNSHFHSLQIGLRRNFGAYTFGANYVWSKSIDNGSSPENADLFGVNGSLTGQMTNALFPAGDRGLSDFDVRHNFNAHWIIDMPFGEGRPLGRNAKGLLNQIIGGWQFAGDWRFRTGFPLSPGNGFNFATNWYLTPPGTQTAAIASSVTKKDPDGVPNLFSDPNAIISKLAYTRPGGVGTRNAVRGPAYSNVDTGLHKEFKLPIEGHSLEFRWTVFNAFNTVNFSPGDIDFDIEAGATFGRIYSTAGPRGGAREMEFALRYSF
jgi:hypothetical protein